MRKLSQLLAGALACTTLIMAGCSPSLKVSTDYDRNANFQQYKTFALYQDDAKKDAISALNADRINNAVKAEMIKKGFTENTSSPDLLVNVITILKDRQSLSSTTDYYGYGGYYRPYAWGGGGMGVTGNTTYNVENYKDGSLIVDIVTADSKKLVWQGTGNSEIDKPLKDPDKQIPEAVAKIMAGFPPGAAK